MVAAEPATSGLPEVVRQRLVALSAGVLESLDSDKLPPALRPVMSFARQRRARVAAAPIMAALDDDDFRGRIAAQLRPSKAELAAALDAGESVAVDPVEVAAMVYLLRPPSWETRLRAVITTIDAEGAVVGADMEVIRLRGQLARLQTELGRSRAKSREQLTALRSENSELRRSAAGERTRLRQGKQAAEIAAVDSQQRAEALERRVAGAQSEQRRQRSRVNELEAELLNHRQADRESRGHEAMRARLLLDTIVDAARGLSRELALPPVSTLPADTLAKGETDIDEGRGRARALATDDPALLQQLLSVPRAHLLVDGYNVTKLAWPTIPLDAQRDRLVRELAPLAARSRAEVTVVFDGAELQHRPRVAPPRGVRVRFSPPGITADDVLLDLLSVEPVGRPLVVVSSDGEVATGATRSGARTVPSATLISLLGRGSRSVGGGV